MISRSLQFLQSKIKPLGLLGLLIGLLAIFWLVFVFNSTPKSQKTALPAPANLSANWQTPNSIALNWDDVFLPGKNITYEVRLQSSAKKLSFLGLTTSEFETPNDADFDRTQTQQISVRSLGGTQTSAWTTTTLYPSLLDYSLPEGQYSLTIAQNEAQRQRGLSQREKLPANWGMLFIFENLGDHGIWMKDMNFAIDVIWLNANFEIVDLKENVLPSSYPTTYRAPRLSLYIMELNAGQISANDLVVGQKLDLPSFLQISFHLTGLLQL